MVHDGNEIAQLAEFHLVNTCIFMATKNNQKFIIEKFLVIKLLYLYDAGRGEINTHLLEAHAQESRFFPVARRDVHP
jgi:hypothetical protein